MADPRILLTERLKAAVAAAATAAPPLRRGLLLLAAPLVATTAWIQQFVFGIPLLALLLAGPRRVAVAAGALAAATFIPSSDVVGPELERALEGRCAVGLLMAALFALGCGAGRLALDTLFANFLDGRVPRRKVPARVTAPSRSPGL